MSRRSRSSTGAPPPPDRPWLPYCRLPEALTPGNRATLLVDAAEAYPAMLAAIDGARHAVLMASYIFNDDVAGTRFLEALTRAAHRGVEVLLIVDAVGTISVRPDFLAPLEQAGGRVLEYRPIAPWRPGAGLFRRDHRKVLVVDSCCGFAGGLNIGDEWLAVEEGGQGWHDIHARVEGPAVRDLARRLLATWQTLGHLPIDVNRYLPEPTPIGDEFVSIIGSSERKKRSAIRRDYLHAIRRARHTILIANAYFLPDRGFRRALRNACARGVDVRVMVAQKGDLLAVQLASEALFGRLLRAGVRIFLWPETVLHAKTAVIDGQWATVGSFNLDHRSWHMNLEVNVNVVGPRFAEALAQRFQVDERHCREVTRDGWHARPLWLKLVTRFFGLFRRLM